MATRSNRFGDEKGIQRNQDNSDNPLDRPNRSPGQSNANRALPSLRENYAESQQRDYERIRRGLEPTGRGAARESQREAAGRAITRTQARFGAMALSFSTGEEIGKAIDEKTGLGKEIVDKSGLAKAAEKIANFREKVTLTKEAKERIAEADNFKEIERVLKEVDQERAAEKGYAKGGMIRANCGASMKPQQKWNKK